MYSISFRQKGYADCYCYVVVVVVLLVLLLMNAFIYLTNLILKIRELLVLFLQDQDQPTLCPIFC